MRKRKTQTELRRQCAAVIGRTEQINLRAGRTRRLRLYLTEWMIIGHVVVEEGCEVLHLIRKIIR